MTNAKATSRMFVKRETSQVQAVAVKFQNNALILKLNNGRQLSLPTDEIKWLRWLAKATPEQRAKWAILPHGFAVYWDELDDGFEVEHALSLAPLNEPSINEP